MEQIGHSGGGVEPERILRFGPFELDLRRSELRKAGRRIRLQEQPLQILRMLLESPGEVVSREEIRKRLWPDGTTVEFDHSINAAITRLRYVLRDSADHPRYIETLARRGYRFAVQTETADHSARRGPVAVIPEKQSKFLDSIAVLPFENSASDPEMEYLSDGIAETILNNLSQLDKVRVVPRTTVFQFKNRAADPVRVGRELGVRVVLTGRVAARGSDLIVSAELIDAAGESQLWGTKYNRRMEDIFAVEEEIAQEIAGKLRLHLGDEERKRLARRPTENREAYHYFLKCVHYANQWTPDGVRKGIECAWKAIEEDPSYPLPYTALAYFYVLLGLLGIGRPADMLPKAKAAALKALEIDADSEAAHSMLGLVRLTYEWDWRGAKAEFERALEIAPNASECHLCYGVWLNTLGRHQDAIEEMQLALDLEPLASLTSLLLAQVYDVAGLEEQAIRQHLTTIELNPSFVRSHEHLALLYARRGMYEQALGYAEKNLMLCGHDSRSRSILASVHAISGRREEAVTLIKDLKNDLPPHAAGRLSFPYAALRDSEQTIACLEKSYQERDVYLTFLHILPDFRYLHGDPRFTDLVNRIGLATALRVDETPAGIPRGLQTA